MDSIETEKHQTGIAGSYLQPLAIIPAKGGPVLHMLNGRYALMPTFPSGFGEIYFSEVLPECIKAWKKHDMQAQLFAVPMGKIKIVLYDVRHNSPTLDNLVVLELGRPDNYCLLSIPPGIWYGFQCISHRPALICNCADIPHDPSECTRLDSASPLVPYLW